MKGNWRATPLWIMAVLLLLLLGGCSGVQVSQDYTPGSDFSRFRTYRWKTPAQAVSTTDAAKNPFMQERFRQAIDGALAVRGYRQAASADFLVSYSYSVQNRVEPEPFSTGVGFGWGSSSWGGYGDWDNDFSYTGIGVRTGGYGMRQYNVSMLVIDFYDGTTGAPVWHGTGSETASNLSTPAEIADFVFKMVDAVLNQFPPR